RRRKRLPAGDRWGRAAPVLPWQCAPPPSLGILGHWEYLVTGNTWSLGILGHQALRRLDEVGALVAGLVALLDPLGEDRLGRLLPGSQVGTVDDMDRRVALEYGGPADLIPLIPLATQVAR